MLLLVTCMLKRHIASHIVYYQIKSWEKVYISLIVNVRIKIWVIIIIYNYQPKFSNKK